MLKKIIISFFALLLWMNISAQVINNLYIIPTHPTIFDTVKVVCHSIFNSSACTRNWDTVQFNGQNIYVDALHNIGMMGAICNSTDTIVIGMLNEDFYNLSYTITTMPQFTSTTETLNFAVTYTVNSSNHFNEYTTFIYPNPAHNFINIDIKDFNSISNFQVEFYNFTGQLIKSHFGVNYNKTVDCSELPNGLYFVQLKVGTETLAYSKLIIQR